MPHVTVPDGTKLAVHDTGEGPAVVLLAGWGFSGAVWSSWVRGFGTGRRVIAVDLRGHGGSEPSATDYEISTLAADVVTVLRELGLRRTAIVGWSFGGIVALRVAGTAPGLVSRLALVGSCGVATGSRASFPFGRPAAAMRDALVAAEHSGGADGRGAVIAGGFFAPPEPALLDLLVADAAQMDSAAGIACLRALFDTEQFEVLAALEGLPVLLLLGDSDRICPRSGAEWVAERLSHADVAVLRDCGHYPMFERPEEFGAALAQFLDGPDPTITGDHP